MQIAQFCQVINFMNNSVVVQHKSVPTLSTAIVIVIVSCIWGVSAVI